MFPGINPGLFQGSEPCLPGIGTETYDGLETVGKSDRW
jgi:hypothetical protein